ncbi:nuclear transport factor 2 family protein [Streptomyces sp. BoleA5]|uniref:nuclear transport factor 2 family protein n=1 Tax=Streptomyces sp. BoleA5 TaxID=1157637 RepID=UPI000367FDB0
MPDTVPITTRAEWETLLDRLAVDELISGYGAAVDDGDRTSYVALLTPDGRAHYTSAGGVADPEALVDRLCAGLLSQVGGRLGDDAAVLAIGRPPTPVPAAGRAGGGPPSATAAASPLPPGQAAPPS